MKCKLSAYGNVKIPAGLLEQLGWQENDLLELAVSRERLVLRKYIPGCLFCQAALELVNIGEYYVCRDCIERLHQAKDGASLLPLGSGDRPW